MDEAIPGRFWLCRKFLLFVSLCFVTRNVFDNQNQTVSCFMSSISCSSINYLHISLFLLCFPCIFLTFPFVLYCFVDMFSSFPNVLYVFPTHPSPPNLTAPPPRRPAHPRLLLCPPDHVRAHHVTLSCGSCMVLMMSSSLANRR